MQRQTILDHIQPLTKVCLTDSVKSFYMEQNMNYKLKYTKRTKTLPDTLSLEFWAIKEQTVIKRYFQAK